MDDQILFLYSKGMTTREIVATFKEMYDADVSAPLISKVTDAVIEQSHCLAKSSLGRYLPDYLSRLYRSKSEAKQ